MNSGFIFPVFLILSLFYSCKSPTPPVSGCDPGYLPCEEDNNHCCEVVCAVPYHNCGDQLTDCCLDTTSHIFNWNIYPLTDDGGSSFSRDAAILAPDDIWAIAYFNSPDTIDGEINPHYYSGAHWDGISWTPKEIPDGYINPAGEVDNAGIAEFQRCFIVDGNVWVTLLINTLTEIVESDYIFHTTSEQWDPYQVGYLVFGAWGTSSENIYLASHLGSILHYNGNDFTLIGATSYPCGITKITGTEDVVYFLANQKAPDLPGKYILAKYESGVLEEIYFGDNVTPDEEQFLGKIYSIWNWGDDLYIFSRAGLYLYHHSTGEFELLFTRPQMMGFDTFGVFDMEGNNPNDIIAVGYSGKILHYNGHTWSVDTSLSDLQMWIAYDNFSIDYEDDTVVIPLGYTIGWNNNPVATMIIGERQ